MIGTFFLLWKVLFELFSKRERNDFFNPAAIVHHEVKTREHDAKRWIK